MAKAKMIVGNWKMHKSEGEVTRFMSHLIQFLSKNSCKVGLAVPYTLIKSGAMANQGNLIAIGAQNMSAYDQGAYTGEVSASMLKEAGATFVLIGHSERRQLFKEDDAMIHLKVKQALQKKISPILCFGETQEEREGKQTEAVVKKQLTLALKGLTQEEVKEITLAYEPVWAIGTGNTASPDDAQSVHRFCRQFLRENWGDTISDCVSILYGGSVKSNNIQALLNEKDIDGGLVGGASLDVTEFLKIINFQGNT